MNRNLWIGLERESLTWPHVDLHLGRFPAVDRGRNGLLSFAPGREAPMAEGLHQA